MAEVTIPKHTHFMHPGDEGPAPKQGQADCPNEAAPPGATREVIQRPGDEVPELRTARGMNDPSEMGYQNVPPAGNFGEFGKGPEVRRTYQPPASGDPFPAMPGAK